MPVLSQIVGTLRLELTDATASATIGSLTLNNVTLPYDVLNLNLANVGINTVQIPTLPANQVRSHTVNVTFTEAEEAGVFDDLKKQINDQRRTVNRPDMTAPVVGDPSQILGTLRSVGSLLQKSLTLLKFKIRRKRKSYGAHAWMPPCARCLTSVVRVLRPRT